MGRLDREQIADAITALLKRDTALAEQVIATDDRVDELQREIEEKAVATIARATANGDRLAGNCRNVAYFQRSRAGWRETPQGRRDKQETSAIGFVIGNNSAGSQ
jgi:phosphate uptake regulator